MPSDGQMKAMATKSYGPLDRLEMMDLPAPDAGPRQIRVNVHASSINPADIKVITGQVKFLHGRNFPLVLGYDFAGEVDTVGSEVSDFKAGDKVFGFLPYGMGNRQGAFSEKIVANAQRVSKMPETLGFEEAASCATAALTALQALRPALAAGGRSVFIHGGSGGVGSYAVQIARLLGATSITATCSDRSVDFVKSLGAGEVLDYRKLSLSDLQSRYAVLFDVASNLSFFKVRRLLEPDGSYVRLLPSPAVLFGALLSPF